MEAYTDIALIELVRGSDRAAFDELYRRYWRLLYMLAVQKTGVASEAEDIVQEIFIDLWNKRARLGITHTLKAYLVSSTYYRIFTWLRQKGLRQRHLRNFSRFLEQSGADVSDIDFAAAAFETEFGRLQEVIDETIERMPGQMRTITRMRYRQSKNIPEIALELGISPLTVKKQLQIAMGRLRQTAGQQASGPAAALLWLMTEWLRK